MIDIVKVPKQLADDVEKELYSIKPRWTYYTMTTDYHVNAPQWEKDIIERHRQNYGPVIDTHRFSYLLHQLGAVDPIEYSQVRNNPKSYHRTNFTALPNLIDYFIDKYMPEDHTVERILINMQTIRPKWSMTNIHPDLKPGLGGRTVLYYVNDSDGDTYFFDDIECIKRVPPVKGTAAVYPSNTYHASSTPIKTETRTVINIVFLPRENMWRIS